MESKLLKKYGLENYITGSQYTIRTKLIGSKVKDEIKDIISKMNIKPDEIYSCAQVHGNEIKYCSGYTGKEYIYGRIFPETDGLITDKKNIALLIKFADCTPIILYDPIKKVQAALHSGWRGTVLRIGEKAIDKMEKDFSSNRKDILAYLGPSIDMENYEVGAEVYNAFRDFKNRDNFFKEHGDKYLLSMIDANLDLLLQNGINKDNIEVSRESTYTNLDLNSARREPEVYKLNSIITIMK